MQEQIKTSSKPVTYFTLIIFQKFLHGDCYFQVQVDYIFIQCYPSYGLYKERDLS